MIGEPGGGAGGGAAEEHDEEDQAAATTRTPPSSPSPPTIVPASSSPHGLGRRLLSSLIRGIGPSSSSPPPSPVPKVGLSLLLHLKPNPNTNTKSPPPRHHPPSDRHPPSSDHHHPIQPELAAAAPGELLAAKGLLHLAVDPKHSCGPRELTDQGTAAGELGAAENDDAVAVAEDRDQAPLVDEQEGVVHNQGGPARDAITVVDPSAADTSAATQGEETPVEEQGKLAPHQEQQQDTCATWDGNAAECQEEEVEQGATDEHGAIKDDVAQDGQEKVLQQCSGEQLRATRGDQEVVVVEQDATDQQADETTHDISVENQEEVDRCTARDDAVEDQEAVGQDAMDQRCERTDGVAVKDQEKALQQWATYELQTTENDDAKDDEQDVVEQGVVHGGVATMDNVAVRDHEVVVQTVTDEMCAAIDDIAVKNQEEVDRYTPRDHAMEDQEAVEHDAIDQRCESTDGIAVKDQEEALEQCATYELQTTENDDAKADEQDVVERGVVHGGVATMDNVAARDHEVVVQTVTDEMCAAIDDTAVKNQDKEVEKCTAFDLGTTENDDVMDEPSRATDAENLVVQEKDNLVAFDKQDMFSDGNGPGYLEEVLVVIDQQSTLKDVHEKVLQQCTTSDQLGATRDDQEGLKQTDETTYDIAVENQERVEWRTAQDDTVEDQEAVEQDAIDQRGESIEAIAVKDQEKAVEQCATCEFGTTENDDAKDDQKVVDQGFIDKGGATTENDDAKDDQKVVDQGFIDKGGTTMDDTAINHQEEAVEKCVTYEGTTRNDDANSEQEVVKQGIIHEVDATMDDIAVKDHEVVVQSVINGMHASIDNIVVENQGKGLEQCTTYHLGATENDDVVDSHEVVEQGVVKEGGSTMDGNALKDHVVVEQSIIDGMRAAATDDIAVEDQEKVSEQCAVNESIATMDEYTVGENEKVVEQGVTNKQGAMHMDVAVKDQEKVMKQGVIDNHGTVPIDDIAVTDREKAVGQFVSCAIVTSKDENLVEEHNTARNQGVIDGNGRTKDDIDVEEHVITDKWATASDGTAPEDQKNESELCISDGHIASKDVVAVHIQGDVLEQRVGDEQGATKFTVEKQNDVQERVCHEWGATEDDLVMNTAASEGISGISSSQSVSVTVNGSDGGIWKEKVRLCVKYPQRPGKLNCPSYMSKGSCSYGLSCHFNHPSLKAKPDVSWFPSEQDNHGVADILELNRVGLPIREGARNCVYYMRNGACRYGKRCHFNHPEHVIDAHFSSSTGWGDASPSSRHMKYSNHATLDDTSYSKKSPEGATLDDTAHLKKSPEGATLDDTTHLKKSPEDATLDDTSYSKRSFDHTTLDDKSCSSEVLPANILRMLLPPQKVPPSTERKVMKVKKSSNWSSTSDDSDGCCSADSSDGPLCKQEHVDYPERPGRSDCPLYKQEHVDYSERPHKPECPFIKRFGDCKFESSCKYHHSKDRYPSRYHWKDPSLGEVVEYPTRPGEPECPFYMKHRYCKFGAHCNFDHPKDLNPTTDSPTNEKESVAGSDHHACTRITLKDPAPQQQQYPERPGQPDCRYYMQFGKCKYLSECIFHHPKDRLPSGWHPSDPAQSDQYDTWQPTNTSRIDNLCQQAQNGAEIHGMPECPFYMKTGKCQFGSACEFRHLKDARSTTVETFGHRTGLAYDKFARSENIVQQDEHAMYPERPGEPECSHYMKHGYCNFQMNCKFHHPGDRLCKKPVDSTYH